MARDSGNRVPPIAHKRGDGLERRSLTGIARERETRAHDTAPCPSACRTLPAPDAATAPRGRTFSLWSAGL